MSPICAGIKEPLHDLRLKLREISDQLERGPRQIAAHGKSWTKRRKNWKRCGAS